MARAREEIRMMGDLGGFDGRFIPTFETAGNGFAPPAPSKLGLADGLDTYLDRVQVPFGLRGERVILIGTPTFVYLV